MKTIKEYISTSQGFAQMWEEIDDILAQFSFDAVFVAMEALAWEWAVPVGELDNLIERGRKITGREYPELATYKPEIEDLRDFARKMLYDIVTVAAASDENECYDNTGGFEARVRIIGDEERKRVFGEDAPDDFKHSVELRLMFIVEDNIPKTW